MPKRLGFILTPEKVTLELCEEAIIEASKRKKKRKEVKKVLSMLPVYVPILRYNVLNLLYKHGLYTERIIQDHGSGKIRTLHIPKFWMDQCVHHVILLMIKDEFIKRFDPYACSCVPGRGTHYLFHAVRRWLDNDPKKTKYCDQGDVKQCFNSIRPKVVMRFLMRFIKDKRMLSLLHEVLYSHTALPLGNVTSGWFQNLVLTYFDRKIREQDGGCYYARYSDDWIALGPNKRKLRKVMQVARETLAELGLVLKDNWQLYNVNEHGIDIGGFRFFRKYTLLRKRNLRHIKKALKRYNRTHSAPAARSLMSMMGQLKWVCNHKLILKYFINLDLELLKRRAYGVRETRQSTTRKSGTTKRNRRTRYRSFIQKCREYQERKWGNGSTGTGPILAFS